MKKSLKVPTAVKYVYMYKKNYYYFLDKIILSSGTECFDFKQCCTRLRKITAIETKKKKVYIYLRL